MVVCLLRITARSRKIIAIFDAILFAVLVFMETFLVLMKCEKILEFHSFGILDFLWQNDTLFLCSMAIVCLLLLFSVFLLIFVFDVAVSQESEHFRVNLRNYSSSIYLIFVSLVLCILSFALALRVSTEFDHKMTKLLMASYLKYGKSVESRRLADRIHMEYSCCGVTSIEDFLDLSEVDNTLSPQTKLWSCNEWEYCSVPLSCCKSTACSQKVALLVKGWEPMDIMKKWFNQKGCVQEMNNSYLLFGLSESLISHFLMILILGFHIGGLVLHQILVSASATRHGARLESSKSSFAWLVDIGQPDPKGLCMILNPALQASDFDVVKTEKESGSFSGASENQEKPEDLDGIDGLGFTLTAKEIEGTETASTKQTEATDGTGTTTSTATSSKMEKVTASSSNNNLLALNTDNIHAPHLHSPDLPESAGKRSKPGRKPANPKKEARKAKGKTSKTGPAKKRKTKGSKVSKKKPGAKKSTAPKKKPTAKPKKK